MRSYILLALLCSAAAATQLYYDDSEAEFINHWAFFNLCKFHYEPSENHGYKMLHAKKGVHFDASKVQDGDLIYVRNPLKFFKEVHPHIHAHYALLTHGQSEDSFKAEFLPILDEPNIIGWFTIHKGVFSHPKLHALPLGVRIKPEDYSHEYIHSLEKSFAKFQEKEHKNYLIYLNFLNRTHGDRPDLKNTFKRMPGAFLSDRVPFATYIKRMANCSFTLAPRGVAQEDSYRIWESLLCGSVPVILQPTMRELYTNLPILMVDDYESLTAEKLASHYTAITEYEYSVSKLYMDYWKKCISRVIEDFFYMRYKETKQPSTPVTPTSRTLFSAFWDLFSFSTPGAEEKEHSMPKASPAPPGPCRGKDEPLATKETIQGAKQEVSEKSSRLKILVVATTFPKLSETFVLNQVTGLLTLGHQVSVYAKKGMFSKMHDSVLSYDLINKTYYETLPLDLESYDVIICQFGQLGKEWLQIKKERKLKAKLVTCFRGSDISKHIHFWPSAYQDLFKEGDFFLTNCQFFKNRILALGGAPEKTALLYSSIAVQQFIDTAVEKDTRSTIRLVTTGRLVEKKGIEDTLYAIREVIQTKENIEYIIVGDGPLKLKLEKLAENLGIENHVQFVGWKTHTELIKILKNSDIFILASATSSEYDQDAIPNVLKEAMACKLPVISTLHGGIPEIITEGETGFLVPEHSPIELASKIRYLIDHPELWQTIGNNGQKLVQQLFDVSTQSTQLHSILLRVCRPPAPLAIIPAGKVPEEPKGPEGTDAYKSSTILFSEIPSSRTGHALAH